MKKDFLPTTKGLALIEVLLATALLAGLLVAGLLTLSILQEHNQQQKHQAEAQGLLDQLKVAVALTRHQADLVGFVVDKQSILPVCTQQCTAQVIVQQFALRLLQQTTLPSVEVELTNSTCLPFCLFVRYTWKKDKQTLMARVL